MAFDTPLLLLAFNRPDTTAQVLDRIRQVKPKQLFVAVDGARADKEGEWEQVKAVQDLMQQVDWDCKLHTNFRTKNLGCRAAVVSAMDWFFEQVTAGIILEDDCVPHLDFFEFCQENLLRYQNQEQVLQIGGFNILSDQTHNLPVDYFFTQHAMIWGWATWRRAWKMMDVDMLLLPDYMEQSVTQKPLFGDQLAQAYIIDKWQKTYRKENSSWAYAWAFGVFAHQGVCILPSQNLVENVGLGQAATHTQDATHLVQKTTSKRLSFPLKHPDTKEKNLLTLVNSKIEKQLFYKTHKSRFLLVANALIPTRLKKILVRK